MSSSKGSHHSGVHDMQHCTVVLLALQSRSAAQTRHHMPGSMIMRQNASGTKRTAPSTIEHWPYVLWLMGNLLSSHMTNSLTPPQYATPVDASTILHGLRTRLPSKTIASTQRSRCNLLPTMSVTSTGEPRQCDSLVHSKSVRLHVRPFSVQRQQQ